VVEPRRIAGKAAIASRAGSRMQPAIAACV
jgi:hypothetical protein